jgi:hypothetical protein
MVNMHGTRSYVHLNPTDIDGLIDIARYGITPFIGNPNTQNLLERLSIAIATRAVGRNINKQEYNQSSAETAQAHEDALLGGTAMIGIWPMDTIEEEA